MRLHYLWLNMLTLPIGGLDKANIRQQAIRNEFQLIKPEQNTVDSHSNVPASTGHPPITDAIIKSRETFFLISYIGNNRNPPITDKNGWSFEIR